MDPDLGITSFKVLTRMFGEIMAAIMAHFGEGTFDFISRFEGRQYYFHEPFKT